MLIAKMLFEYKIEQKTGKPVFCSIYTHKVFECIPQMNALCSYY